MGQKPRAQFSSSWGYGKAGTYGGYGAYPAPKSSGSELAAKWAKGTKLYHDDYGYGVIVSNRMNGNEFLIEVQFETGNKKTFIPQYQSKSLQIIK